MKNLMLLLLILGTSAAFAGEAKLNELSVGEVKTVYGISFGKATGYTVACDRFESSREGKDLRIRNAVNETISLIPGEVFKLQDGLFARCLDRAVSDVYEISLTCGQKTDSMFESYPIHKLKIYSSHIRISNKKAQLNASGEKKAEEYCAALGKVPLKKWRLRAVGAERNVNATEAVELE
jgi:hypothetical protein